MWCNDKSSNYTTHVLLVAFLYMLNKITNYNIIKSSTVPVTESRLDCLYSCFVKKKLHLNILNDTFVNCQEVRMQQHLNTKPEHKLIYARAHTFYAVVQAQEQTINNIFESLLASSIMWQTGKKSSEYGILRFLILVCAWWQCAIAFLTWPPGPNGRSIAGGIMVCGMVAVVGWRAWGGQIGL